MQDRPTAIELLRAAQEFCKRDLLPNLEGRVRFHARVLQNVLGILEREWEQEEDAVRAEWARLRALLGETAVPPAGLNELKDVVVDWNRRLSADIRAGELDDTWDETVEAIHATVAAKLGVANPRHSVAASSET
ncbi:MAG: DUF6285 domain-containing protein [Actinomycetota bacterium]